MDFLKICRAELDRLIEQSPPIPDDVIREFKREFEDKPSVKKPEICDGMEHTNIYDNRESALKHLTAEAAITLFHKKKMLREEVIPDLNKLIHKEVYQQVNDLSGAVLDIYTRKQNAESSQSRRGSFSATLTRAVGKALKTTDGNWKRKDRSVSPRQKTEERENTLSDVHIEIVGQNTLQSERKDDMGY
jgi:hypothetical protein